MLSASQANWDTIGSTKSVNLSQTRLVCSESKTALRTIGDTERKGRLSKNQPGYL